MRNLGGLSWIMKRADVADVTKQIIKTIKILNIKKLVICNNASYLITAGVMKTVPLAYTLLI